MRILFMGTPDFAAVSLKSLCERGFDVVGVFTQPDKPVGRKQRLEPPAVKVVAERYGIPVFQPTKLRDGTAMEIIRQLDPELIAVVAYGRILPDDILEYPRYGSINIHGSILPKYRGAAPIQWSVLNGDSETGVTAMYMANQLDAGDIIEIRKTGILNGETSGELFDRLAPVGADLLCDTIVNIENGTAERMKQNDDDATFAPQLTKEMAQIDWNCDCAKIVNTVNGMNPWPIASAEINGSVYKIYKAYVSENYDGAAPGHVVCADKDGITVACGIGSITITEIQAPGGKRMAASDYIRGHKI